MSASYRRALTPGPFLRLLAGHGIATLGQLQLTMAVGVYVLDRTDSGVWVSAAVAIGFAPYVLFSAAAGMFADRHCRSSVLRWSISARIVTGALTTAGLILDWPVPLVILLAALTAAVATPSYPAPAAATAQVIDDQDLPAASYFSPERRWPGAGWLPQRASPWPASASGVRERRSPGGLPVRGNRC